MDKDLKRRLDERFVEGEIDAEEYEQILRTLEDPTPPLPPSSRDGANGLEKVAAGARRNLHVAGGNKISVSGTRGFVILGLVAAAVSSFLLVAVFQGNRDDENVPDSPDPAGRGEVSVEGRNKEFLGEIVRTAENYPGGSLAEWGDEFAAIDNRGVSDPELLELQRDLVSSHRHVSAKIEESTHAKTEDELKKSAGDFLRAGNDAKMLRAKARQLAAQYGK